MRSSLKRGIASLRVLLPQQRKQEKLEVDYDLRVKTFVQEIRLLFIENVLNPSMTSGKSCFASFGMRSLNISASFASVPGSEPMRKEIQVNS